MDAADCPAPLLLVLRFGSICGNKAKMVLERELDNAEAEMAVRYTIPKKSNTLFGRLLAMMYAATHGKCKKLIPRRLATA